MGSGNFIIGNGLVKDAFEAYVLPRFQERNYDFRDILFLGDNMSRIRVLASITGEGDLEKGVNEALMEAGESIEAAQEDGTILKGDGNYPIVHDFAVKRTVSSEVKDGEIVREMGGVYELIGVYDSDETASQLFPSIAQSFLLDAASKKAKNVESELKRVLGKKLSEL